MFPIPCSPEIVPPHATTSSIISCTILSASSSCPGSSLYIRLTCILPSPMCPKFATYIGYFLFISSTFNNISFILLLGTQISSFILWVAILYNAGEIIRLTAQMESLSFAVSATLTLKALFSLQTLSTIDNSCLMPSPVPSISINNNAFTSSSMATSPYPRTAFILILSINSNVRGRILLSIIESAASIASFLSPKKAANVSIFSGWGISFTVILVKIPNVPSEPTKSLVRS